MNKTARSIMKQSRKADAAYRKTLEGRFNEAIKRFVDSWCASGSELQYPEHVEERFYHMVLPMMFIPGRTRLFLSVPGAIRFNHLYVSTDYKLGAVAWQRMHLVPMRHLENDQLETIIGAIDALLEPKKPSWKLTGRR